MAVEHQYVVIFDNTDDTVLIILQFKFTNIFLAVVLSMFPMLKPNIIHIASEIS